MRIISLVAPFILLLSYPLNHVRAEAQPPLSTKAERTQWQETGRYEEVERLCAGFSQAYPDQVRCFSYGTTPEGRNMLALAVGEKAFLTPGANPKRPVVAFQGGIHAGEIDGKDAGFAFIRDVLGGKILPGALSKVTLLFIPVFNVDGHERFEANSRPNQIGPKEKGWRVTAQNFNLNRDYLKADSPEMKAMIRLLNAWDPILYVDLHVTDGAKFQHDIGIMIEPSNAGPEDLRAAAGRLTDKVMKDLKAAGNLPVSTYPSFIEDDNPASGLTQRPARAAFSNGYWAYRNRLAVLVETHSWRPYAQRVQSTYNTLKSLVEGAMTSGKDWLRIADQTDAESQKLRGNSFALSYSNTKKSIPIDFLGYAYTRKLSPISGQMMTRYDDKKPEVWRMPFFPEVEAKNAAIVPRAFIIPAAYAYIFEDKLKLHGIRYETLKTAWKGKAEVFRAKVTGPFKAPNESHQKIDYDGAWEKVEATAPAGSLQVNMDQPLARLSMMLLEPLSPDSLLAWGFLNQVFERKEYMEAYVAEEVAETMLKDPRIKAEFEARLKDPEFAKDAEKRLDFFAEKHPSYDQNYLKYPVLKVN